MTPWAIISPARLAGPGLLRTQSDERLVDMVRAGNDRAFEAILLRYHRPLLRHCRRLLPPGRAEDAVQQTLLSALQAMRADDRDLQLGPWLHRIAQNTAIDWLRRIDSHWEQLDERMGGVEPTHAAVERRARFHSVITDMGTLPERQRRALVLRELEGRSYDEIAATLGVTGHGVRQLLNRARNAMRAAAGALVPPALVGRMAGSQAGVRIAELMDPPGTAMMAKATAAVAAGAVALVAVAGPPSGDGGAVPHAEAAPNPSASEVGADAQGRPARGSAPVPADLRARRSASREPSEARRGGRGAGPDATAPRHPRAGAGPQAAAGAPVSGRAGETIRAGAGGGQTGAGGGQSVSGDDDDVALGIDDEMNDEAAWAGEAPDDGDGPGVGEAPGGDDEPEDAGQQVAVTGTRAPDAEDAGDDARTSAPTPTSVQVTASSASSASADEDDDDADE